MVNTEELRRLAQAANANRLPWRDFRRLIQGGDDHITDCRYLGVASPATVLALLDRLAAARSAASAGTTPATARCHWSRGLERLVCGGIGTVAK